MSAVLVVNSGSSSFKYQLLEMSTETVLASGLVERIGEKSGHARHIVELEQPASGPEASAPTADGAEAPDGTAATGGPQVFERDLPIPDHTAGFKVMLDAFAEHGPSLSEHQPVAVGHRVVHGGKRFFEPTVITPLVEINIEDLSELAPLHNPGALQGIRAAEKAFPHVPHVAVFDTAFHQSMPAEAYTYAIDPALAERYRVRRYGFHGTSFKYVSEAAARFLQRPLAQVNQIVLHLGNGASACAIAGGKSVETSMGMTPLQGLVMGTRSGDIDPAVLVHLHRRTGATFDDLDELLNRRSGLLGMTGHGDMRDVQADAAAGDDGAQLALDVYLHRIKHYVGAYTALLGRVDAIVFTAGVGENNAAVRAGALAGLDWLGVVIDPARNGSPSRETRLISSDESRVAVLVVPTDEEVEIARQTLAAVGR